MTFLIIVLMTFLIIVFNDIFDHSFFIFDDPKRKFRPQRLSTVTSISYVYNYEICMRKMHIRKFNSIADTLNTNFLAYNFHIMRNIIKILSLLPSGGHYSFIFKTTFL